jgi:transcriptional regulator with XRE-family HTH domain
MKKTRKRSANRNVIGRNILKARLKHRPPVSQEDLAGRLAARGILLDRSAISRIENQSRYLMDYEILAIARSLKTPIAKLFPEQ